MMNDEWIEGIASGYRQAQVLLAAVRLGVFSKLGEHALSAEELAKCIQCSLRGTRILCDALAALGLLIKEKDAYRNTELGVRLLVDSSAESRNPMMLHNALLYERWAGLLDAVREGGRTTPVTHRQTAEEKHAFARAMAVAARETADKTAALLGLSGASKLLDVGGGPGMYALAFAGRNPQLIVSILDDAGTLAVAEENIKQAGLESRINCVAGDILDAAITGKYDFIFISNVIHCYSAEQNRRIVNRCRAMLEPGGRLCLKDFFVEPSRTAPEWNAVFAVNMLLGTENGDCYTLDEAERWLRDAGFGRFQRVQITERDAMIIGSMLRQEQCAAD